MRNKKAYFWSFVGRLLPQAIYLITTMVLARFLTPEDFGVIGVLTVFFMVANTLMDAGLGGSLIKEKEISKLDCSSIAAFNCVVSIILYALLFILSEPIEKYYEVEGVALVARVLCSIFVLNSLGLVPYALLMRELRFRTLTIIGITSAVLSMVVAIVFAINHCGVWALVAYQLVGSLVRLVMNLYSSKYKLSFRFSWDSFRKLISFGAFTTLISTIDTIYENLIVNIFGKGFSIQQAGYLSQAKKLEEAPSATLASTISSVSFPVLTKLRDDDRMFVGECKSVFKTVQILVLPLLVCISLFAKPILHLVFGSQWIEAAPYLELLMLAGILRMAETLNRSFLKALTVVDSLFVYTIIKRVIGISLILFLLFINKEYVLWGYVFSTLIGFLVNAILLSRVSSFGFWEQIVFYARIVIPSVLFYLIERVVLFYCPSLSIQIILTLAMLGVYYFVVMPFYGIKIAHIVRTHLKALVST